MTETRTTSTSLGTYIDGGILLYETSEIDLIDATFATKTTYETIKTADEKTVAEDDGTVVLASADEFTFGGTGDDSDGTLVTDNHPNFHGDDAANVLEGSEGENYIYGYGGADTLFGNGGGDHVYGGDGSDDVYGGTGNDYLNGGAGNDDIFGGSGHDELKGQEGHDTLYGGEGNDLLWGKSGNDTIYGDAGDDTFRDNVGDDIYTGGAGADTFDFNFIDLYNNPGGGNDLIEDFELGVDKIQIWNGAPEFDLSFNDYIDQFASGGGDTGVVIEWQNGLIRLPGIEVADLNPWDFELDYTPWF